MQRTDQSAKNGVGLCRYSDMSRRTHRASVVEHELAAERRTRELGLAGTPVGPRKINEPIGRVRILGARVRARRNALATASTASLPDHARCRRMPPGGSASRSQAFERLGSECRLVTSAQRRAQCRPRDLSFTIESRVKARRARRALSRAPATRRSGFCADALGLPARSSRLPPRALARRCAGWVISLTRSSACF